MFSFFARKLSELLGTSMAFFIAIVFIVVWLIFGPYDDYNDTWQLTANTITSIITFLMVFIIQNTQNRDTKAIQLKLDEILRATENAHNRLVKVEDLSDKELDQIYQRYEQLSKNIKSTIRETQEDTGTPEV